MVKCTDSAVQASRHTFQPFKASRSGHRALPPHNTSVPIDHMKHTAHTRPQTTGHSLAIRAHPECFAKDEPSNDLSPLSCHCCQRHSSAVFSQSPRRSRNRGSSDVPHDNVVRIRMHGPSVSSHPHAAPVEGHLLTEQPPKMRGEKSPHALQSDNIG